MAWHGSHVFKTVLIRGAQDIVVKLYFATALLGVGPNGSQMAQAWATPLGPELLPETCSPDLYFTTFYWANTGFKLKMRLLTYYPFSLSVNAHPIYKRQYESYNLK